MQPVKQIFADGAPGAAKQVIDLRDKTVHATGGFTGTVDVEGSIDGSSFAVLDTLSDGDIAAIPSTVKLMRVDNTNVSAGAAVVTVLGRNARD